ncbi:glycosyltransferase [Flavobacterium psychrophilum]
MIIFSILITTKNRLTDLKITLQKIAHLIERSDVTCVVYDDGSADGTSEYLKNNHPNIQLHTNIKSKGYIYNRNYLLNNCEGKYAISLDDDSNILTENCLEIIENHFNSNKNCAVIACRIFWGKEEPFTFDAKELVERVNGFVGCGHVWNLKAWKDIPNYPEWFEFYGEENFASFQLLKKGWTIQYVPQILVHHRVDVIARKNNNDYQIRRRRSLRAGWYNYFIFYPISKIPRNMASSVWQQLKNHTFKGNLKATVAMVQATFDLFLHSAVIFKTSNRLAKKEYSAYCNLPEAKIYWNPTHEK